MSKLSHLFYRQIRAQEGRSSRVFAPVIGIVVDNRDPLKLARIRVFFPTIPGSDSSSWATIASLGAGKDRGWFFLPEIDDEVLVMFEHGDIRRPVVIGALWNGSDIPPQQNDGGNTRRVLVSRAGSRLEMDDDAGTITMEDGAGLGKITISADNKITLATDSGDVCLSAPAGTLNVVADSIEFDGQTKVNIQAQGDINASSDNNIDIKGGAQLQISGSTAEQNPSHVASATQAQADCQEVPDPLTETGSGDSTEPQSESPSQANDTSEGESTGSDRSSAPPGPLTAPATEEPDPVLVSAQWEKNKAKPGDSVTLRATCNQLEGTSATFRIFGTEEPDDTVASCTGICGADKVETSWTIPTQPETFQLSFEVTAADKNAAADVLTLVKDVEVKLICDEEPALNTTVKLRVDPSGELIPGETDQQGVIRFEDAPMGEYTLFLAPDKSE